MADLKKRNPVERLTIANTLIQSVIADFPTQSNAPNTLDVLDCVSRQAAIDALEREIVYASAFIDGKKISLFEKYNKGLEDGVKVLKALPSAQRTGRWIYNDYGNGCGNWHCSVCNKIPIVYDKNANYCPHCGAEMEEQE